MTFYPAENVVQVQMLYNQGTETVENVYNVQFASAVTLALLADLTNAFKEWEVGPAHDRRSSEVALVQIIATDLTSATAMRLITPVLPTVPGGLPANALPGNATLSIHANSTSRGRGTQGRTYWIGLSEGQVDGNFVDPTSGADIVTALEELIPAVSAVSGATLVTLHGMEGGTPLNPRTTSPVTSWVAKDFVIDSQKSRLPGHRRHKRAPIVP